MTAKELSSDDPAHDFHPVYVRPYLTGGADEPAGNPPPGSPSVMSGTMSTDAEPGVRPAGPPAFPGPQPGDERTSAAGPADAGPSTETALLKGRGRIPGRRRLNPLVGAAVAAAVGVVVISVAMVLPDVSQESHSQNDDYVLQPKSFEGDAIVHPSGRGKASPSAGGPSGSPSGGRSPSAGRSGPAPSGTADGTAGPGGKGGDPAKATGSGATDVPTPRISGADRTTGGAMLAVGERRSFRSVSSSGDYVVARGGLAYVDQVSGSGSEATFTVVGGLADSDCFSFVASDGDYLRHRSFRTRVEASDGSALFKQDSTFCPRPGSKSGSVSLESYNYSGYFLRAKGTELWLEPYEDTAKYAADSSFLVTEPPG